MKQLLQTGLFLAMTMASLLAAERDTRCYEMRIYYAAEGKLDDLNARFRNHTCNLFEKHGMQNIGYWMPLENPERKLVYILAHASRDAARASWKAFGADPEWRAVAKSTEANGPLVKKVDSKFFTATEYSPAIKPAIAKPDRVFELRTYTTTPGNLAALDARFRDHTINLFSKHGMENFGYWHLMPGQKGVDETNTLVYLLAHKSKEAGAASFTAFREDPAWVAAKKASEEKAGGSLTTKDGVKSEYMAPTDYSQTK